MFKLVCLVALALVAACSGDSIPEDRIVGGSVAWRGQFPWIVSLRQVGRHNCGGSIINQRWILTAAHCLDNNFLPWTTVVTNTLLLNSGGDSYRANRFVIHPNYNSWTIRHDVGVVQTASNIVWRANAVAPVRLPTSAFNQANVAGQVAGWGTTSFPNGVGSNQLLFLNTWIISQAQCAASSWRVTNENICTLLRAGQGNCHGDSGGPLMAGGIQIGIVSFADPCARGTPDVYARVFTYLSWIRGHTG